MKNFVGIDLGTTNSAICSYDGSDTRIWKSPEQNDVTPSAILFARRGNKYLGVRAGTTVKVDVPIGSYEVRYACGKTWYGYDKLFGPDTVYSKADQLFDFKIIGNESRGFTITLYEVAHGNLQTSNIRAENF